MPQSKYLETNTHPRYGDRRNYFTPSYRTSMTNDPVLFAYTVKRNATTGRSFWTRIGRAYPHDVGAGLTVILDALPRDGRIVLLELDEADHERILAERSSHIACRRPAAAATASTRSPARPPSKQSALRQTRPRHQETPIYEGATCWVDSSWTQLGRPHRFDLTAMVQYRNEA